MFHFEPIEIGNPFLADLKAALPGCTAIDLPTYGSVGFHFGDVYVTSNDIHSGLKLATAVEIAQREYDIVMIVKRYQDDVRRVEAARTQALEDLWREFDNNYISKRQAIDELKKG